MLPEVIRRVSGERGVPYAFGGGSGSFDRSLFRTTVCPQLRMATTSSESPIALVTGCSTGGIGPELALFLVHSGYIVYASARKLSNMPDELAAAGCRLLELDVCRSESLEAARDKISAAHGGRFNLLINNVRARTFLL